MVLGSGCVLKVMFIHGVLFGLHVDISELSRKSTLFTKLIGRCFFSSLFINSIKTKARTKYFRML
jgi:hypothetical protein